LSLQVPTGDYSQSFEEDILSGIDVSVMEGETERTPPHPNRKVVLDLGASVTDMTLLRGGIPPAYSDQPMALPLLLVGELPAESAPGGIMPTLAVSAQLGFRQGGNSQVFDADQIVGIDEFPTALVQPVVALVACASMDNGNPLPCFLSVATALLLAGVLPLHFAEFTFLLAVEPRRSGLLAFTAREEGFQTGVQSDRRLRFGGFDVGGVEVADKRDRPLARRLLLEGGGLDLSFHLPMQDGRNQPYFWNGDTVAFHSDALRNAKRVGSALLALSAWILRSFLEEVDEGAAQVAEDLLQRLGVTLVEESEVGLLFEEGEFLAHLGEGERLARLLVVILTTR